MNRSEALVAAAFRGFAEALVAAEAPAKKAKDERPMVIPVDAVKKAVQDALPGIIQQMADEAPEPADPHPFGIGEVEDLEPRQRGGQETFDANQPGSGGWRNADV